MTGSKRRVAAARGRRFSARPGAAAPEMSQGMQNESKGRLCLPMQCARAVEHACPRASALKAPGGRQVCGVMCALRCRLGFLFFPFSFQGPPAIAIGHRAGTTRRTSLKSGTRVAPECRGRGRGCPRSCAPASFSVTAAVAGLGPRLAHRRAPWRARLPPRCCWQLVARARLDRACSRRPALALFAVWEAPHYDPHT